MKSVVVLTGAGVSAESGIATFRDKGGLWEGHDINKVATLKGYRENPSLVHKFYNARRSVLFSEEVKPNAAHIALALLEREWKGKFLLVTQNIDNLHERAGSKNVIHMHGELLKLRCEASGLIHPWSYSSGSLISLCPCCKKASRLRPHVVWFGEAPLEMPKIESALRSATHFVSIGTSGRVYPAAGFVRSIKESAESYELNVEDSWVSSEFKSQRTGKASETVPILVNELIS